ncbi:MAG: DUF4159 domain-containing protein [Phycisphaerae bacterium]|nr:DUF4159 domain-containing protein [Phycisphaerae bacterium]
MKAKIFTALMLVCILLASGYAAPPPRETTDDDIDRQIEALKNYLWTQQESNGSWEKFRYAYDYHLPANYASAVITYALLEAGGSYENDPRLKKAVAYLVNIKSQPSMSVRAFRVMVLGRIPKGSQTPSHRAVIKSDLKSLSRGKGKWKSGKEKAFNSQANHYAAMALWEARQSGYRVSNKIFSQAMRVWLKMQRPDGGWSFAPQIKTYTSEIPWTAAGLASMYITRDALSKTSGRYKHQGPMDRAWGYLDSNLKDNFVERTAGNSNPAYTMFCIQQIGMTSGRKFIAGLDWYALSAAKLSQPRPEGTHPKGYWGPIVRAAYELIMLSRGRMPLTFNKLNYGDDTSWNYHPRDIARFTEYMQRHYERTMRWQIVKVTDDIQTLLDAPIMLIEGKKDFKITSDQWAKLREYTLRGGTLVFVPCGGNKKFLASVQEGLKDLYVQQRKDSGGHYELKELTKNSPLYTMNKKYRNMGAKFPAMGISDGTRLLVVVLKKDIANAWQKKAVTSRRRDFALGANLFFMATGTNNMASRMRPIFSNIGGGEVKQALRVAWIKHGGNYNTQPYALEYLSGKLKAENQVELEITKNVVPSIKSLKGYQLAWITGSGGFALTENQIAALRVFIYKGGTLFVNAVGGSSQFSASAEIMLGELFSDQAPTEPGVTCPLLTGRCGDFRGPRLEKFKRTISFRKAVPRMPTVADLYEDSKTGRILAIFVRYGVHDTLDGHTPYGAKSYMPKTARGIAANVALYALWQATDAAN